MVAVLHNLKRVLFKSNLHLSFGLDHLSINLSSPCKSPPVQGLQRSLRLASWALEHCQLLFLSLLALLYR